MRRTPPEAVLVPGERHVLDEDVGEGLAVRAQEGPHLHLLHVNKHPVQLLDGTLGGHLGLVVDVAVALAGLGGAVRDQMFPTPLRRTLGTCRLHVIRHGLPRMSGKFRESRVRSASAAWW